MIITETDRLLIRNWRDDDIDLFHEINSDPQVMEFFPFRRNRQQALEMMQTIQKKIAETSYGFFALEQKSDGSPIGFGGLAIVGVEPLMPADTVKVGWRLAKPPTGEKGSLQRPEARFYASASRSAVWKRSCRSRSPTTIAPRPS